MKRLISAPCTFLLLLALLVAACGGTEEIVKEIPFEKRVVVEKEVIKEVPVEKIVEKVVIKEVPVEKIVEKEVIKKVEVEKEVVKRVVREVVATAMPLQGGLAVEQAKYGGSVKVTSQGSIKSLDPSFGPGVTLSITGMHTFDKLAAWDSDYVTQPTSVDTFAISADGLTWTFTLRDNRFSTGDPVTAEDAVESFKSRWTSAKSLTARLLVQFRKDDWITALDDRAFKINLKEPFGQVLDGFAPSGKLGGYIFHKDIFPLDPNKDIGETNYIGSGPYMLKSWEVGHQVVLERNPFYTPRAEPGSYLAGAQIPYIDEITWLEIPSEETKLAGLRTGEWDLVDQPSLDSYTALLDAPGIKIALSLPGAGKMSAASLNLGKYPTDNVTFRDAIYAAVDGPEHLAGLGPQSLLKECGSIYFCGHPAESTAGIENYSQNDPEKAKRLLAEMGYDGEEFVLLNPNDFGTITPLGPVLAETLRDIGVNVSMPGMDWSTVVSNFADKANNTWNAYTSWHTFSFLKTPLTNFLIRQGGAERYENEKIVDLQAQYTRAADEAERARLRDDIQLVFYEDKPVLLFGTFFSIIPYSERLKNLSVGVFPVFSNVYLEK